jgi:hypothetical protein
VVYDESRAGEQVFDVGQLRLRFSVTKQGGPTINSDSESIRERINPKDSRAGIRWKRRQKSGRGVGQRVGTNCTYPFRAHSFEEIVFIKVPRS